MSRKNILVISSGRRCTLVSLFRNYAHKIGGQVIAADLDPLAPSLREADKSRFLPRLSDPEFLDRLIEIIDQEQIGLAIPVIDTGLQMLALSAERLSAHGCKILPSSSSFVEMCSDKWLTFTGLDGRVAVPKSWLPGMDGSDMPEDLFVKPRDGSASINAFPCTRATLESVLQSVPNAIIQERLVGREVTIDALFDFDGVPIHFVPRTRIRTIGGESIQGVTLPKSELGNWLESLLPILSDLGARGPNTIQCFITPNGPVLTEINPRFGGGYPLAHAAGGTYPEWLMDMMLGQTVAPRLGEYTEGLYMSRAYREYFFQEPKW